MTLKSHCGIIVVAMALLSMVGCVQAPRRMHYHGWTLVIGDQRQIDDFCQRDHGTWDDGEYIKPGQHNAGCWDETRREAWVVNSCVGAESIPHEMAHMEGVEKPDDEGYGW